MPSAANASADSERIKKFSVLLNGSIVVMSSTRELHGDDIRIDRSQTRVLKENRDFYFNASSDDLFFKYTQMAFHG